MEGAETIGRDSPPTPGALLRRCLRRQRGGLGGSIALITLWQVCETLVPVLIGVVVDQAVEPQHGERLLLWCVVLAVHFAVLSTSYRLGARLMVRSVQLESHRLRTEIADRVLDERGARTSRVAGDLLTVATSDAEKASEVMEQVVFCTAAVLGLGVTGVVLAAIDPFLAVVVLLGVPTVLVVTQVLAPRLARRSRERQEAVGDATGVATDLVRGIRPLAGIGAQDVVADRYRASSQRAAGASVSAARWEGLLYAVTAGLSGAFLAAVAVLAGLRALDGQLGIGELVAVVGLAQFVAEPMRLMAYMVAQVAESRASAARVVEVLTSPPLTHLGPRTDFAPDADALDLDGVEHRSLRHLTLHVRRGELLGLVVDDPADATALVELLRGDAVPGSGEVRLGGTVLTDLAAAAVRSRLLVVDHHVDLFEGTLRDNVDPAQRLDGDGLRAVLAASAADDVVDHAHLGLDDPVRTGGTTLSGGQRQRLGLARALAQDADLLVLHDPTSAVDAVTEQRIADGLRDLRVGRTTVVITSSPALLARADRVAHIRGGAVAATGSHHELAHGADDSAYALAVLR